MGHICLEPSAWNIWVGPISAQNASAALAVRSSRAQRPLGRRLRILALVLAPGSGWSQTQETFSVNTAKQNVSAVGTISSARYSDSHFIESLEIFAITRMSLYRKFENTSYHSDVT